MSQKRRLKKTSKKPAKRTPKKKAVIKRKSLKKKVKKVTLPPIPPMKSETEQAIPLPEQLRIWLQTNVELINITGWERKAGLSRTTLRQISAGKRVLSKMQLLAVTGKILPELRIIALLLMKYEKEVFNKNLPLTVN